MVRVDGTLHSTIDRFQLNIYDRFVGITVVRDCPDRAGEFFRDRCFTILPALRIVGPDAEEPIRCVRKVVCSDARDFLAPETGLCAESKGNLLLQRLRLID